MRSRRGLRMQREHGVSPVKENHLTRAPLSLEVCRLRSRHCAWGDSFELVRAFREHSWVPPGVAGEMRPTDFCTPKHFKLEHPGFAVSQRCDRFPRKPRSLLARRSHSYRALRLVLVHAKRLSFTFPLRSPEDARRGHRLARGHSVRTRPGSIAVHNATPASTTTRALRGGRFLPPRRRRHVRL
jgi:hypothetical protein